MQNNLTPEQRINKHGHVVTKHIRASRGTGNSASVPPPVLKPVPAKAPRGKDICDLLSAHAEDSTTFNVGNMDKINELSNDHRTRLMSIVRDGDKLRRRLMSHSIQMDGSNLLSMIIDTHEFAISIESVESSAPSPLNLHRRLEVIYREFDYMLDWDGGREDQVTNAKAKYLSHALGVTDKTAHIAMVDYDDYVSGIGSNLEVITPALPVIMASGKVSAHAVSIDSMTRLARFANDYPNKSDLIRSTILTRGSADMKILEEVVSADSAALAEGAL